MEIPNIYTLPFYDFVGGSTEELVFHFYFYKNKKPFDLYSCTANFSIVDYANKRATKPLVSKPMIIRAEPDRDGEVCNVLSVTLKPTDTRNLSGKYIYQISIRDVSGAIEIPKQGILHIINNINKPFTN